MSTPAQQDQQSPLRCKPATISIIARPLWRLLAIVPGTAAVAMLASAGLLPLNPFLVLAAGALLLATMLAWERLLWQARTYTLTTEHISATDGVLRTTSAHLPTSKLRATIVYQSIRQRIFGLGSIGFASSGTDTYEVVWAYIDKPAQRLEQINQRLKPPNPHANSQAISHPNSKPDTQPDTQPHAPSDTRTGAQQQTPPETRPVVIGLAGGIGAGKSHVASILETMGCSVTDSDKQARAVLDRPEVARQLAQWWGESILTTDGKVDRAKVASIVFEDPRERHRLERLIHPLVHQARREHIAKAVRAGTRAVVIDAPLLFETGIDAECDAVIFVDAPVEERLERVRSTRGWDEAELQRREQAQLPLDEKQQRSHYSVTNSARRADLQQQVDSVLKRILQTHPRTTTADPPPQRPPRTDADD